MAGGIIYKTLKAYFKRFNWIVYFVVADLIMAIIYNIWELVSAVDVRVL